MQSPNAVPPQKFGQGSSTDGLEGSPKALATKDLRAYSALALPLGFVGIPLYLYAPDFYAVEYGLHLSLLSLVLLALRLFDAVQDPFIGLWSDRFPRSRGLIVSVSALVMAAAFLLLFLPPFVPLVEGTSPAWLILWFTLLTLISTTAFSVLTVNHNALGALWTERAEQKPRIVTYREVLGLLGLMVALVLPVVLQEFMGRQVSFLYFGALIVIASVGATFLFRRWLRALPPKPTQKQSRPQHGVSSYWALLFSTEGRLFQIYALSTLASAFPAVLVLMFVRDYLQLETSFPLFMLAYVFAGIVFMPAWKWLGTTLGLRQAWMISMLVGITAFVWVAFISAGDQLQFLIICILTGGVFGADIVIPQTLVAIKVHEKNEHGQHGLAASSLFALLAFLGKTSLAVATGSALLFLDLGGFTPAGENTEVSLFILLLFYALIPCALKLGAALLLVSDNRKKSKYQEFTHET